MAGGQKKRTGRAQWIWPVSGECGAERGARGQKGSVGGSLSVKEKKGKRGKQRTKKPLLLLFCFLFQMREPKVTRQSVDELRSKCSEEPEGARVYLQQGGALGRGQRPHRYQAAWG